MASDDSYWKLLEGEGRFNTIQATIRGVAATWLLATMAAVGLTLRSDANAPQWLLPRSDIVLLILSAASIGLMILWILDIKVYQRLLGATFVLRLYMEYRDPGIPPLGASMMASSGNRGMTRIFGQFYWVPSLVFAVTGLAILALATPGAGGLGLAGRLAAVAVQVGCGLWILTGGTSSSIQLSSMFPDPEFKALFGREGSKLDSVLEAYARNASLRRQGKAYTHKELPDHPDGVAPDGSDVRLLLEVFGGGMAHFELAEGEVSTAVKHRTVEEIWFVVGGRGLMWRLQGDREEIIPMVPGLCLTLPLGTSFQFRSLGDEPLSAIGVTMPPWPGPDEAVVVPGEWEPTVPLRA